MITPGVVAVHGDEDPAVRQQEKVARDFETVSLHTQIGGGQGLGATASRTSATSEQGTSVGG